MKIINSLVVALLMAGSAWAGDGSFYLIDLDRPNAITYVQKQGKYYYYSSGQSAVVRESLQPRKVSASTRALLGEMADW